MKLKGFKKSDGTIAKIYTDPTLTESDSPADAASVKAKDDLLQQGITNNANYAAGLNTRLSELENGAPSIIAPKVTEWLNANVDPTGSAVTVDSSLTIAGSAADAKKTGDEIGDLKSDIKALVAPMILETNDVRNAFSSGRVGDIISYLDTSASKTIVKIISVIKGQQYTVSAIYGAEVASTNSRDSFCIDNNNVITHIFNIETSPNSTKKATFTAPADGFLSLTLDAKYVGVEIEGLDTYASEKIIKRIDENAEEVNETVSILAEDIESNKNNIDTLSGVVNDTSIKAKLISCFRNIGWIIPQGAKFLVAYCNSVGVDGWIDVKPKREIDSTTGEDYAGSERRQATDFIDVNGFASFSSEFADANGRESYYAVRCYSQNKEYIGTAPNGTGDTGALPGAVSRFLLQNTYYVRLLLTPNTQTEPTLDLDGIYTGRILDFDFEDSNNITTKKSFALVEVEAFNV